MARAVELLLGHWDSRTPLGPCHWGIGSLFLQIEYPFLRYNIFYYVYILSFFARSKEDRRFEAAFATLDSKLNEDGQIIFERPHRGLRGVEFCAKGQPSDLASARYREICENVNR